MTETLYFFTILNSESFGCIQGSYLFQSEINRIVAAIAPGSIGKLFVHVGCAVQSNVVQDNQLVVTCHHQILFDVMRTLRISHCLGLKRVLWQIATGTPMGNDNFLGVAC